MIDSMDVVYNTLGFIVPGFLIDLIIRFFIPKRELSDQNNLLYYLSLSSLNYAVWSGLVYAVFKVDYFSTHPIATGLAWFWVIFIGPIIIANLILLAYRCKWIDKIAKWIRLHRIHPIPTAWDFKFINISQRKWVIVVLTDGEQIAGLMHEDSFASSDPSERDIYLEEIYDIKDSGVWEKIERTDGILIKGEAIKFVQFWNDEIEGGK